MAADFQTTFRRYGRFYQSTRKYMQRREVLVSTNVILTLFTISFFAAFAIRPTALTISRLWREIRDKRTVQMQLTRKIADLGVAQSALADLGEDLSLLTAAVPATDEFSRLVRLVEYLASQQGLLLTASRFQDVTIYQSAEEATAGAAEVRSHPFSLSLTGSFRGMRSFIVDLERLDRFIAIRSLTLRPSREAGQEGTLGLQLTVELVAYSFPNVIQGESH